MRTTFFKLGKMTGAIWIHPLLRYYTVVGLCLYISIVNQ